MNLDEMRDRIDGTHSDLFKRMLKVNELPEPLLKRYFVLKAVLDKVDGHISAEGLLRIAMDVGLNPETVLFEPRMIPAGTMMASVVKSTLTPESQKRLAEAADGETVAVENIVEETEVPAEETVAEAEEAFEEIQKAAEEDSARAEPNPTETNGTFEAAKRRGQEENAEAISQEIEADAAEEVEKKKVEAESSLGYEVGENGDLVALEDESAEFKNGTPVEVFADGQVKEGVVKCSFDKDGELWYKVETNDTIWEIFEDDVQLVED